MSARVQHKAPFGYPFGRRTQRNSLPTCSLTAAKNLFCAASASPVPQASYICPRSVTFLLNHPAKVRFHNVAESCPEVSRATALHRQKRRVLAQRCRASAQSWRLRRTLRRSARRPSTTRMPRLSPQGHWTEVLSEVANWGRAAPPSTMALRPEPTTTCLFRAVTRPTSWISLAT